MKKVVISIPVHECSQCVENQIINIKQFVPDSTVILHISADSPPLLDQIKKWQPKYDGFVFLNPTRYKTFKHDESSQVTNLSSVHASNVLYANSIGNFDIIAYDTSNSMWVRHGIHNDFENYLCGIGGHIIPPEHFISQEAIAHLRLVADIKLSCKAAQEGMWANFQAGVFFANKIKELEQKLGKHIAWEEGTLAHLHIAWDNSILDKNTGHNFVYHDASEGASVKREMIHKVRNGEMPHKYAVKRVPRNINDVTRTYINELNRS